MSKQKIAHVMLSVMPKKAGEILKELDEPMVLAVGEAVLKHAHITEKQFKKNIRANNYSTEIKNPVKNPVKNGVKNGAKKQDEKILIKESHKKSSLEVVKALYKIAFGTKKAQELIKKLLRRQIVQRLSFFNLYKSADVLECIKNESPTVISVVLGAMHPDQASHVLLLLPFDTRVAVMKAIAKQGTPDEMVISIIEKNMGRKLQKLTEHKKESAGGIKNLSHILKHLPMSAQNDILGQLHNEELEKSLIENINSWDIFQNTRVKHVETIILDITMEELACLVYVYGIQAKRAICLGLSNRNQQELDDEIELYRNKKKARFPNIIEIKNNLFEKVKESIERFPVDINTQKVDAEVEFVE